ncbi:hypothetical protein [Kaistella sp.]|uniref:hypothetical protein n=1 Tax=Kaistella sp. TaxID=2782235 RepID=UPI003C408326
MKIIYPKYAIQSLDEIVDFLENRWTEKELRIFENDFRQFIKSLEEKIISYPFAEEQKVLRFALLGKKQVKVYFDLQADSAEIILFLPSKSNPEKINQILKKK